MLNLLMLDVLASHMHHVGSDATYFQYYHH